MLQKNLTFSKPERNLENQHKQAEKVFSEEHNAEADGGNHH